jgi:hypothetical protein
MFKTLYYVYMRKQLKKKLWNNLRRKAKKILSKKNIFYIYNKQKYNYFISWMNRKKIYEKNLQKKFNKKWNFWKK